MANLFVPLDSMAKVVVPLDTLEEVLAWTAPDGKGTGLKAVLLIRIYYYADPDPLCGSGSGIQKMSMWIRIRILGGKD